MDHSGTGITLPIGSNANTARINVSINYQFKAIIPKLVPFETSAKTATSARTIVTSIEISGSGSSSGEQGTHYNQYRRHT